MRQWALSSLLLAASATCQQAYFNPPIVEAPSSGPVSAERAAALISHVFGTTHYTATSASNYADLLPLSNKDGPQLVLMIDCPPDQDRCDDALPTSVRRPATGQGQAIQLPNLPLASWASLLTLELSRMASEYGISPDSIWGLDSLVDSIKKVPGWVNWVTKELGDFIGWHPDVKDARQKELPSSSIVTDVDLLDDSGKQLVFDLEQITKLAEAANPARKQDSAAAPSQVFVLHLKGLRDLSSESWQRGSQMLSQSLEALFQSVQPVQTTVLSLPPYKKPLLSKRTPFLDPFRSRHQARYFRAERSVPEPAGGRLRPRSVLPRQQQDDKAPTKVVPHSHMCFKDADDVNNQTANCLSHGEPVKAISNYLSDDQQECWVCSCEKGYGGQGCEKTDVSSGFMLLFLSAAGLILVFVASVALLFGSGNEPLPSTLAAVSGAQGAKLS